MASMEEGPSPKRTRRESEGGETEDMSEPNLQQLLRGERWDDAVARVGDHPEEAKMGPDPSPLAIACRSGAPYDCICALLEAAPERLRHVLDSRGTPLHEAIVCEGTGSNVIEILLKADEALGSDSTRATLLQDVDGFTPLHLLIRRRFQSHILRDDEDTSLMEILEMLVRSCPESVVIPDRGEYEEPPIIYAVKANIYAPALGLEDETVRRVERQIYEMVRTMLRHAPTAAAQVFNGFRGQYTALHSAVFHGRYATTIDLILRTEAQHPAAQKAALLANTQGEIPLHFCVMRGERPHTVALIASAAPQAVLRRDASGLTPFHWLWARFVSTLLALEEDGRGSDANIPLRISEQGPFETNHYNEFTSLEQGDFDADLQTIKRLDPPVDFLRMRHIPVEVSGGAQCLEWSNRSVEVLKQIRERYSESANDETMWTRQEAVAALFWTKVVSLLEAARNCTPESPVGDSVLVHTAFCVPCCLPPVAHLVASLFPEEMMQADDRGRLPIHYAAARPWHAWDWPRDNGAQEGAATRLLRHESVEALRGAMRLSPSQAVRVADNNGRIALHHAVQTFVTGCAQSSCQSNGDNEGTMKEVLDILKDLVQLYPDSLHRRDGVSKLYPFLQASAAGAEEVQKHSYVREEFPLSISYTLLRENPSILASVRPEETG